ncbi:MAG: hypothetical protein LBD59_09370 [Prevotellaceae bacterium]|jgi:hypothetical protein|nr:hypothetical protein [Prevotellaceae bacterium]
MKNNWKKDILDGIAALVLIGILLGITVLIINIKETHLQKEGVISNGIITYCANKQLINIAYCFRASNNVVYTGKRSVNKQYNIGDTIYVVYLENNPEKHKMMDKYSEHDQKFLQNVQIRLANDDKKQIK